MIDTLKQSLNFFSKTKKDLINKYLSSQDNQNKVNILNQIEILDNKKIEYNKILEEANLNSKYNNI